MYIQSLLTDPFYINNIKATSLYSGYVLVGYMILQLLTFFNNNLPNAMFYLLFSYMSIRVHETIESKRNFCDE